MNDHKSLKVCGNVQRLPETRNHSSHFTDGMTGCSPRCPKKMTKLSESSIVRYFKWNQGSIFHIALS